MRHYEVTSEKDGVIYYKPIKGTKSRTTKDEDQAEFQDLANVSHKMIVVRFQDGGTWEFQPK